MEKTLKKVGITGGIGAGKSSFCDILAQLGYPVISADKQAKKALNPNSPCYAALLRLFNNPPHLTPQMLAQKIFSDSKVKNQLESIMHPYIFQLIQQEEEKLKREHHSLIFYEIPLLFEKKLEKYFHFIILITCDENLQKKRVMKRFLLSESEAINRIHSQMSQQEKLSKSDFIVENNTTLDDLKKSANQILKKIMTEEKQS